MKPSSTLPLLLMLGILVLSSCGDKDVTPDPASNCPNSKPMDERFESANINVTGVMLGSERMFRIRANKFFTGICTADHIYLTTSINVVDTAKKYITLESAAVTAIGNAGITFPMASKVGIGNKIVYQSNHQGFLINPIYPSPGPGSIEAGINVRFQSFGSSLVDSIFFYKNVSDYTIRVEYAMLQ